MAHSCVGFGERQHFQHEPCRKKAHISLNRPCLHANWGPTFCLPRMERIARLPRCMFCPKAVPFRPHVYVCGRQGAFVTFCYPLGNVAARTVGARVHMNVNL
eukprot:6630349-Prymnesium_polylepis.2